MKWVGRPEHWVMWGTVYEMRDTEAEEEETKRKKTTKIQSASFVPGSYIRCLLVNWKSFSCVWLCDPMDFTVHGILQARIVEWVAILFSRGSSQPREQTQVFHIAGGFFTNWVIRETQDPF